MGIKAGYAAECCLCGKFFHSKTELDAHDKVFAAEHRAALEKGLRPDFGKSFSSVEFDLVADSGPEINMNAIQRDIEIDKQLAAQVDPIEKLFGPFAYSENRGQTAGTYVSTSSIGHTVEMNDLLDKCSAGQNMLFESGESYGK